MAEASGGTDAQGGISNQLATLVPSFDPSKDDLQVYQQKVQLVTTVWPQNRLSELVTRLILNTTGSAFAKLQLHHSELATNDTKSVQKLIEYLGGQWGKTGLEKRYADAEKALFQCSQQTDESHDSYLARADVLWSKLKTQKLQIDDLQAYITLRGAQLSSEDKKRIILDSDASLDGTLTIGRVQEAVRLLGTSFFNEMTGLGKKASKSKVYDSATLAVEDGDSFAETEDQAHLSHHEDWNEDDILETMLAEGDEDAVFVSDFESAASEVLQSDDDLAAAFSTYVEARRKLNEKFRSRGFWPLGKGKGRASKGKGKGRMSWGSRKTLQQRILESNCRLCGKKGHWRNECPNKGQSASSVSNAAVTLSVAMPTAETESSLPEEFLLLPEMPAPATKDILSSESVFVQSVFYAETSREKKTKSQESSNMSKLREKIRNHIKGTYETNFGVKSLVSRIEQKLRHQALRNTGKPNRMPRILRPEDVTARERPLCQKPSCPTETAQFSKMPGVSPDTAHAVPPTEIMFATHDTWGILDTGATKTVMGSDHIKEFLEGLNPTIKDHVKRCSCEVLFRFGNQGTLKSSQALVLPVGGMRLKIAVVKGATPFLISNTLLRALGALIDTQNHQLKIPKFNANINLKLTSKGLYLIDMNKLTDIAPIPKSLASSAETFAQDTIQSSQNAETVNPDVPAVQMHEAGSGETEQLSNKHTTTTLMEENPIQEIPLSSAEITSKQPVTHRVHAEITTKSTVFSPSIRAPNRSVASPWTHEQLEPTLVKSAGTCGQSPRAGTNQPSWAGRAEDHANGLWKSPCGENVPRDMGHQPLVDQVVSGSLCIESEDRAQAHDSIHSPEDRGVRGRDAPTSRKEPSTCLGRPPEKHSGTQPDHRDTRRDRVRDDVRGPMGQSSRDQRGHQCSPGKNAQPGDSHAAHAHHDAECHAVDKPSADQHPRICCSRMGRSLEQLDEHQACSHWDHQAGEIDNFWFF